MPITAISRFTDGVTIVLLFGNNEFSVWSDVSNLFSYSSSRNLPAIFGCAGIHAN
jgi:hypothetical protein